MSEFCECGRPEFYFDSGRVKRCCWKDCNKPLKPKTKLEKLEKLDNGTNASTNVHQRLSDLEKKQDEIIEWLNKE